MTILATKRTLNYLILLIPRFWPVVYILVLEVLFNLAGVFQHNLLSVRYLYCKAKVSAVSSLDEHLLLEQMLRKNIV